MKTVRVLQEHVRIGDPHVTSDNAERLSILGNVFDCLVSRTENGLFAPRLATSWQLSDDCHSWRFKITDSAVFHDGKRLNADDVAFSLLRVRDNPPGGELGTGGVIAGYLAGSEISATGHDSIEIKLATPMADLLDLIVDIPILSEQSVSRMQQGAFVGTGAYQVVDHSDDEVRIQRTQQDQLGVDRQAGTFQPEQIEWSAVPGSQKRAEVLMQSLGESKPEVRLIATNLAAPDSTALDRTGQVEIFRSQTTVCATFMFNLLSGAGTSRHLRRAINYAVDVHSLIEDIAGGAAIPLTGPMTSLHLGFDPSAEGFEYNPVEARKELALAGALVSDKLTLDVPTKLPDEAQALAERIAEYLRVVGLEVQIVAHEDRPGYAEMVKSKQIHDAACFDSSPASTYRLLREKFHSGLAGPWWLGYSSEVVDRLIDEGARTADVAQRRSIYQRAYRTISEDAAWLYLYNPVRLTGVAEPFADEFKGLGWKPQVGGLLKF